MKRLQAFKFELIPTSEQAQNMRRFAGSCRFVINKALAWQTEQYAADNTVKFSYTKLASFLPIWKNEEQTAWLKDTHSQCLQQALKDLERAYQHFFAKRADFPKFKKRGQHDSFRYPQGFKLEQHNNRIYLPKIGFVRYRNSQEVLGTVKNVTVSQSGGKWTVSIQTEREVESPIPTATGIVGIDMGITRFATLSDGNHLAPLNSFKKHQKKLAKYQRRMARQVKFGKNWQKQKAKARKLHQKISNVRKDYLHKATHAISQNHAIVCIEDLQIRNMSKSAKGDADNHGKNVAQKSGLNRSILDQGWGEFGRQLDYKLGWKGGQLIRVNPKNTSRTCPRCHHVCADNRKTQAAFKCVECGYQNHADLVGAMNILERGHRLLACEVSDAVMSPAAGTHRSELNAKSHSATVGISVL